MLTIDLYWKRYQTFWWIISTGRERGRERLFYLHMSNTLKELVKQKCKELIDCSEQEKNLKHKSSLD